MESNQIKSNKEKKRKEDRSYSFCRLQVFDGSREVLKQSDKYVWIDSFD